LTTEAACGEEVHFLGIILKERKKSGRRESKEEGGKEMKITASRPGWEIWLNVARGGG
jgi:hypothetical protein